MPKTTKLTAKQQLFIRAYLDCLNATEAAERAGYKGDRNTLQAVGGENLAKPIIREAVDDGLAKRRVTGNWILERLRAESEGEDPRIRVRALEILARHTITTKQEVEHSGTVASGVMVIPASANEAEWDTIAREVSEKQKELSA